MPDAPLPLVEDSAEELARRLDLDLDQAARVLSWVRALATPQPIRGDTVERPGGSTIGLTQGITYVFSSEDLPGTGNRELPEPLEPQDRYEDRGLLGQGGMGEVRRVFDRQLERSVAMKILSVSATDGTARFVDEARTIARLQHPGVLPVHEIGRLPDGRVYFTMQEIRGRTLRDHVKEVHAAAGPDHWRTAPGGWTFRRLVAAFQGVCEAVAYAHSEGVVHRDLKPRNVMIGEHGEVLVVDWGLARARGTPAPGGLVGTPAYLAPELLRAGPRQVHPRTDVYALGAILYNLLTNRSPFEGRDAGEVLEAVRRGPSPVPESELPLPAELVEVCVRAMTREPGARIGHAGLLAAAVRTWLDGSRKRDQALDLVARGRSILPEAEALRSQAAALEDRWGAVLAEIPTWAPEHSKHEAWAGLDRARSLRAAAEARESEAELVLQGALTVDPTLPDAHAELAVRNMARHAAAERRGDQAEAAAARVRLQRHLDALPAHHASRSRIRHYLRGGGQVTLLSDPPGARVLARKVQEQARRYTLDEPRELGHTPLDGAALGHGSWVLELLLPGHEPVCYPLRIGRGEHWLGLSPGGMVPAPVHLPAKGTLGPDDCYVPAGWCWVGGDPVAYGSAERRQLWLDAFVIQRFPVTNRRYIDFLDDLVDRGQEDRALRHAPRERAGTVGEEGALIYGRDADGHFLLRRDAHGDLWRPQEPVLMIDWHGAAAFAAWEAERTGLPWRLPSEWEWEKAARGVDERPYPWGRVFDPSRACTRMSHEGHANPSDVDSFPVDRSVYGVRGLAGNVRDWCLDAFHEVPPPDGSRVLVELDPDLALPRVNRGGFWLGNERDARSADRHFHVPTHRAAEIGFRLARSLSP